MDKQILLTGHTGFLGSVIHKELQKSFRVLTLGRDTSCDYKVDFLKWDGSLELLETFYAIVHVAGLAHKKSVSNEQMWIVNAASVDKLLRVAEKYEIRNFVFISSVAVYGKSYGFDIDELTHPKPKSVYGKTKLYSENKLALWGNSNLETNYLNLRLPLIIGKNPPGNLGKLIYSISNGNHIYLDGNIAMKSFVFSSDVAKFISVWIKKVSKKSGTINLCNESHPTVNWVEQAIAELVTKKFKIRIFFKPMRSVMSKVKGALRVSIPIICKLFCSLTFSDQLARENFGYTSKPLNITTLRNEINQID